MNRPYVTALERLTPALKDCWEVLLRLEPVTSAMAAPDTLVYLMDDTIGQLLVVLRSRSLARWITRTPQPVLPPYDAHCRCNLNPLITYFVTGERALGIIADLIEETLDNYTPSQHAAFRAALARAFHLLAQREMNIICEVCLHASSCRFGPVRGGAFTRRGIAVPGKPMAIRPSP